MADLRIVDAPEIPTENITGEEKLPTGGSGNYSISLDSLADYTKTKKDLADNTSVDGKVNGVRQELDAHIEDLLNPHQVTKGQIGLGNVDNTADADKPVSNSTQAAIISAVSPKADKSSVYTKAETYSRQETQGLVDDKISTALSPISSEIDYIERYTPLPYTLQNYAVGQRVTLSTGEIVENHVPNNNVNPNTDMLGWVKVNSADQIIDESGLSQQEINDARVVAVNSIADLLALPAEQRKEGLRYLVASYYGGLSTKPMGGGEFLWSDTEPKNMANGGTILDPDAVGGFDGTFNTVADLFAAQGNGVGMGCFVAVDRTANAVRFGLSLDSSADIGPALLQTIDYASRQRVGDVILPAGVMRLRTKVSYNFGGNVVRAVHIKGQGSQTQIVSSVIGDTSIELIDAASVVLSDFMLYGNNIQGAGGNGHGIALRATGDNQYPNGCEVSRVFVRRCVGSDYNGDDTPMGAAGIFIDQGVTNTLNKVSCGENYHGIYMYRTQQCVLRDYIGYGNTHSNMFAHDCLDTLTLYNPNTVYLQSPESSVSIGNDIVPAAAFVFYNTSAVITIRDAKAKGQGTYFRFIRCRKPTIDGGWMLASAYDGSPAVVVSGDATSWHFTMRGTLLTGTTPHEQPLKGILLQAEDAGRRAKATIEDVRFHITGVWDYLVRVENSSDTGYTFLDFNRNTVWMHEGAANPSLETVIHVDRGVVNGSIEDNTFMARTLYNTTGSTAVISNILTTSNQTREPVLLKAGHNSYQELLGGSIPNKLPTDTVMGNATVSTATAGVIRIPVNLTAAPIQLTAQLANVQPVGATGVYIAPDQLSTQSKNQLTFIVKNSAGEPYSGSLNIYYSASTGARY